MVSREELALRTRRTIIDFARRRQRPGAGSAMRLTDWSDMQRWPNLTEVLAGLRWAIAGAVATRSYMPESATRDLDIVVLEADAAETAERLSNAGFARLQDLAIPGSNWRAPSGQEVDMLIVEGRRWADALERATKHTDQDGSPVLALSDLVLMKLESGRAQDAADVIRMLGFAEQPALEEVRETIARLTPELREDLGEHDPNWANWSTSPAVASKSRGRSCRYLAHPMLRSTSRLIKQRRPSSRRSRCPGSRPSR